MIETQGLTKTYGAVRALRELTVAIEAGEVFGLLGPNGSGKTTMIRLLLGLLRPTSGRASVAGFDCWSQSNDVRRLVSYLPGELRLFGAMRGIEVLRYLSDLRGVTHSIVRSRSPSGSWCSTSGGGCVRTRRG